MIIQPQSDAKLFTYKLWIILFNFSKSGDMNVFIIYRKMILHVCVSFGLVKLKSLDDVSEALFIVKTFDLTLSG